MRVCIRVFAQVNKIAAATNGWRNCVGVRHFRFLIFCWNIVLFTVSFFTTAHKINELLKAYKIERWQPRQANRALHFICLPSAYAFCVFIYTNLFLLNMLSGRLRIKPCCYCFQLQCQFVLAIVK